MNIDRATDTVMAYVRDEIASARDKFPLPVGLLAALGEEYGETCKAMLDEPMSRVEAEAIQVACVAIRLAVEGDPSLDGLRKEKGL